jgi:hypothetical protein
MQKLSFPATLPPLFRGGSTLIPRLGIDVLIDKNTGLLQTDRGISVFADASKVERFGGALPSGVNSTGVNGSTTRSRPWLL